jgi:hypothetical protein
MPKSNVNPYLVSFSTAVFNNETDNQLLKTQPQLVSFLVSVGFSKESANYISDKLEMEETMMLRNLTQEDIEDFLPALTHEEKTDLLDAIAWIQENQGMFDDHTKVHQWLEHNRKTMKDSA